MSRFILYRNLIATISISLLTGACSSDNDVTDDYILRSKVSIELSEKTRTAANSLKDFYISFTTDMAKEIDRSDAKGTNIVVSPISAAMTFAMAANGVEENARQEYVKYLGTDDIVSLNALCATLMTHLPQADNTAVFSLANSMWINNDINLSISREYADVIRENFLAEIMYENFNKDNTKVTQAINNWCASKTGGLISSHFDAIPNNSMAVLINALYFKGRWESEYFFTKEKTYNDIFHGHNGDSEVEMMQSGSFDTSFANDGELACFFIPFGNSAFQMEIVMPTAYMTADEIAAKLTPQKINDLHNNLKSVSMTVHMPKFHVAERYELNKMLNSRNGIGMTDNIHFTMFSQPTTGSILYSQSTSFSVDEAGAVAASVSSGDFVNTVLIQEGEKIIAKLDSPFFFFIKEFSTGACILSGRISDL